MGDFRNHLRSFGGGEVTPEFFGMLADPKFQTGLAKCRNFMVKPHGPVENRPGTEFVREVKNSAKRTRLIPFVYGFGQSLVIEFADDAFRFHAEGQTILSGGVPYEVAHTYSETQLFDVTYAQSGDVIKLAHRDHPRRELRRTSSTSWSLVTLAVGPALAAPTGTGGSATPGTTPGTPYNTSYVVTAVTLENDESLQSAAVTLSNNLYDDGAYNTITWAARTGAGRYNVYKMRNGLYGFIGQTEALTFRDDNIAPDLGTTPPIDAQYFAATNDYPGAVAYQDQRAVWAGTNNQPQSIWMTQAGSENNFNYSIPAKDDDAIQIKIASRENNAILHLVPMADLIACTPAALWRISGGASEVITPASISAREQTFVGSSSAKPVKVGNNMIYVASRGGHLREFGFDGDRNGYVSGDVSIRAPHLFDTTSIRTITAQQAPYPIVWSCTYDGLMIGLTYIPEQQVAAFHWHDTDGSFEDATTIYEEGRDATYVIVKRVINGVIKRYVERFASREFDAQEDQFFVDSGATYRGVAANNVVGLDWLEGKEVAILADGAVVPPQTITGGVLELPNGIEATVITVGLPYVCELQTLPMSIETQGYGQGLPKNVNAVYLRVYRSAGIFAGPTFDELTEAKLRTTEPLGTPTTLKTGEVEIVIGPGWGEDGQVCVQQADPVALTVLSMTLDIALGGG